MPDSRRHRGPHPRDRELFAESTRPELRSAVDDLSWLLGRGYARESSLKLVGDRFELRERQRTAVSRSCCSDEAVVARTGSCIAPSEVAGRELRIDGFNLLTTIEAAMAGGVLLLGRDGCLRDMASMHGSYRRVEETEPALAAIGETLTDLAAGPTTWWFDSPVSNSGRITSLVREVAEDRGWSWTAEVVRDPDPLLQQSDEVVVSADSEVLDRCRCWLNLARLVVERFVPEAVVVDLSGPTK